MNRFVARVLQTGQVWGLRSGENWAYCASNEYEDADVFVVWSDRATAQRNAQGEWSDHKAEAISLAEFVDFWLGGMDEDGLLVGLDWHEDEGGPEVEPSDLAAVLGDDEAE